MPPAATLFVKLVGVQRSAALPEPISDDIAHEFGPCFEDEPFGRRDRVHEIIATHSEKIVNRNPDAIVIANDRTSVEFHCQIQLVISTTNKYLHT